MKGFGEYSNKTNPLGVLNYMHFEKRCYSETIDKNSRLHSSLTRCDTRIETDALPLSITPFFFPNPKIQPSRHLTPNFQIRNGNQSENGSAVPP